MVPLQQLASVAASEENRPPSPSETPMPLAACCHDGVLGLTLLGREAPAAAAISLEWWSSFSSGLGGSLPVLAISLADGITLFGMLILSLSIHEFGHSWSATKLGDPTSKRLGRLTLNPAPHLDPMYSLMLPALLIFSGAGFLFGAGKPVPVDTRYLRHPHRDMLLISVAGPAMNVVLALLLTAVAWGLGHTSLGYAGGAARAVHQGIALNLLLALFNMLPVPPLDGHRVLGFFLPDAIRERFYRMQWLGLVLLLFLLLGPGHDMLWGSTLKPLSRWWRDTLMPDHWPYGFF